MSALLILSTADTDLLALSRATPPDYGPVQAQNPARVAGEELERLITGVRQGVYWAVGLRLLGGRRAFPEGFDALRGACLEAGVPLLAWPIGRRPFEPAGRVGPRLHRRCRPGRS